MKFTLLFGAALFSQLVLSVAQANTGPSFVLLTSDQTQYAVGKQALLTATIQIQPSDADTQLYLSGTLTTGTITTPITVTQISTNQAAAYTPTLSANSIWTVSVYLQNKVEAKSLGSVVTFYTNEINTLQQEITAGGSIDPTSIAELQAQITRDQGLITVAQNQLNLDRRLIETDTLNLTVSSSGTQLSMLATTAVNPTFTLILDRPNPSYQVGEQAVFSMVASGDGTTSLGDTTENVMTATLDQTPIGIVQADDLHFSSTIPGTSAGFLPTDVGFHRYVATLSVRSKLQANLLREGLTSAQSLRSTYLGQLGSDPLTNAYLQSEISDLTNLISDYYNQLQSILTVVGSEELDYTVLN